MAGIASSSVAPQRSAQPPVFASASCGQFFSLALAENGDLYAFGSSAFGQLGLGTGAGLDDDVGTPTRVEGLTGVVEVSAGPHHCGASTRRGQLFTWGQGSYGALGHGNRATLASPKRVRGLARSFVRSVACAEGVTVALGPHKLLGSAGKQSASGRDRGSTRPPGPRESVGKTTGLGPAAPRPEPAKNAVAAAAAALLRDAEIPAAFLCPITCDVMVDPHFAADGHTYERAAILEWLQNHQTSPMTGATLDTVELIPNRTLKAQVDAYRAKRDHVG